MSDVVSGDGDNPVVPEEPVTEGPSEEPTAPLFQETFSPLGHIACKCAKCREVVLLKDLTVCPLCGSSALVACAKICFCNPCNPEDQDIRWRDVRKQKSEFNTVYFNIPCQPNATASTPRPTNLAVELSDVTCPQCLEALGIEIDSTGQILTN